MNWKMKPVCSRRRGVRSLSPSVVMSWPAMVTLPAVGRSSPARICISVDLPEPDGPMTAVRRPVSMSRSTPRSAGTAVSPAPYRRTSPLACTTEEVFWRRSDCMASTVPAQAGRHGAVCTWPGVRVCAPGGGGLRPQEPEDGQNPPVIVVPRRDAELVQDAGDVLLHSALGDLQPVGDA